MSTVVLLIVFCAIGLASRYAHPGDVLRLLHELLYPMDGER